MKSDSLGLIFKVEKRLGRGDLFELISHFSDGSKTESVFAHEFHDGMGALKIESQKWSGAEISLPYFQLKTAASLPQILHGLRGLKDDMTPSVTRWKSLDKNAPYSPNHLAWRVFSNEATQRILQTARSQKVSLNTLLLYFGNKVISEKLFAEEQSECRWLIPVNMRRPQDGANLTRNCTSSVGLRFHRDSSAKQIEIEYRASINKWRALAANALAHAAARLGEERLFRLARMRGERNNWIGSFSNLGVWNFPSVQSSDHWPTAVSVAPPAGTPCFPIGIGLLTWQGNLSISLRVHSGLIGNSLQLPEELLSEIVSQVSNHAGSPLDTLWSSKTEIARKNSAGSLADEMGLQ